MKGYSTFPKDPELESHHQVWDVPTSFKWWFLLSDSESLQISRTLIITVLWSRLSSFFFWSPVAPGFSRPSSEHLRASTTIRITVNFIFRSISRSLARSWYLSKFSASYIFTLCFTGLGLWHINHCWLFNAKSVFIHINSSISNNSAQYKYNFLFTHGKMSKQFYFKLFSLA